MGSTSLDNGFGASKSSGKFDISKSNGESLEYGDDSLYEESIDEQTGDLDWDDLRELWGDDDYERKDSVEEIQKRSMSNEKRIEDLSLLFNDPDRIRDETEVVRSLERGFAEQRFEEIEEQLTSAQKGVKSLNERIESSENDIDDLESNIKNIRKTLNQHTSEPPTEAHEWDGKLSNSDTSIDKALSS